MIKSAVFLLYTVKKQFFGVWDMTFFDEAKAIKTMLARRNMKRDEVAEIFGLSKPGISNKLRLLKLSPEVRERVIESSLSERHARLLLKLSDTDTQLELVNIIFERKFTVAEAEAYLEIHYPQKTNTKEKCLSKAEAKERFLESIKKSTNSLASFGIGTSTKITYREKKSYITIIIEE